MIDRCPTCGRKHKRSNEANRRYWLLLHMIAEKVKPAEGITYSAETWHLYFKQRFIGADEVTLPNGKTHLIIKSSSDLDTGEFNDYMQSVEVFAAGRDVYLEDLG